MGKLVAIMICKHEDNNDIYRMFALVALAGTSTKHFYSSSSAFFWLLMSSTILNTAIGHAHNLDTAIHEYGVRQSMISCLSMDLRRVQKSSRTLREMEQAQEEDRKERQKSKDDKTLWLTKGIS